MINVFLTPALSLREPCYLLMCVFPDLFHSYLMSVTAETMTFLLGECLAYTGAHCM